MDLADGGDDSGGPDDSGGRLRRYRRRLSQIRQLARAGVPAVVLTGLYYVVPLDEGFGLVTLVELIAGLLVFSCLVAWLLFAITRSDHPRLLALEALATVVPLFLILFSGTYYLFSLNIPEAFSEPLGRTDALYFTMTVFATVGFGDIVPVSTSARGLVTAQMAANLILVGIVAKLLFGAVRIGLARRSPEGPGGSDL
ncbi:potassium channel family protein [Streptomyces sp. NPDC101733]|uniref:potassium channel family protein n=1 Tax=unclassified Streptomyces TaxID=2593676 RepID=UPI00380D4980